MKKAISFLIFMSIIFSGNAYSETIAGKITSIRVENEGANGRSGFRIYFGASNGFPACGNFIYFDKNSSTPEDLNRIYSLAMLAYTTDKEVVWNFVGEKRCDGWAAVSGFRIRTVWDTDPTSS